MCVGGVFSLFFFVLLLAGVWAIAIDLRFLVVASVISTQACGRSCKEHW